MSSTPGLHARTGSIKRTPSDLSRSLAAVNLPPPSAITAAGRKKDDEDAAKGVNDRLRDLDLDEPEGEQSLLARPSQERELRLRRELVWEQRQVLTLVCVVHCSSYDGAPKEGRRTHPGRRLVCYRQSRVGSARAHHTSQR